MPFGNFRELSASAHVEEDRVLRPASVQPPADVIESIEI
jgi:hypothetical protein